MIVQEKKKKISLCEGVIMHSYNVGRGKQKNHQLSSYCCNY